MYYLSIFKTVSIFAVVPRLDKEKYE